MKDCLFCNLEPINSQVVFSNKYFNIILDGMPISPGHLIIIPRRHVLSILDLSEQEFLELKTTIKEAHDLINALDWKKRYKKVLDSTHNNISRLFITNILKSKFINAKVCDFNLGINDGENAGRTIHHLHIHMIPRFKGDVEDPVGGIRNVIPGMANYHKTQFTLIPPMAKILSFAQKGIILSPNKTKILVSRYITSKYLAEKLNGKLCLPGGQMEWGEDPDESFIREVNEETGIQVAPGAPIMIRTWKYQKDNALKQIVAVFRIGYYKSGKIALPLTEHETTIEKAKWVSIGDLNPKEFVIDEQLVIREFLRNHYPNIRPK